MLNPTACLNMSENIDNGKQKLSNLQEYYKQTTNRSYNVYALLVQSKLLSVPFAYCVQFQVIVWLHVRNAYRGKQWIQKPTSDTGLQFRT